jgi:hypothetical protein
MVSIRTPCFSFVSCPAADSDTQPRKIPWRLSPTQKARQRKRLRAVDQVVETLSNALAKKGETLKSLERWKAEMPTEAQMLPRDKYTMFDRKAKRYRKGIHSMLFLLNRKGGCVCAVADVSLQNSPSGRVCRRESTRQVTRRRTAMVLVCIPIVLYQLE